MKMNLQQLSKHLERHRESPTLKAVAEGRTTFVDEIKSFYDFEGSGRKFRIHEEDPRKIGHRPDELADLVDGFFEKLLDTSHLSYEEVREGVKNAKPDRTLLKALATGFAFCLAEGLTVYALGENGYDVNTPLHLGLSLGGFMGVPLLYSFLSPRARAEERSIKQCNAAVIGGPIREEDKGTKALGSVNYMALRERARKVDNLLALGRD